MGDFYRASRCSHYRRPACKTRSRSNGLPSSLYRPINTLIGPGFRHRWLSRHVGEYAGEQRRGSVCSVPWNDLASIAIVLPVHLLTSQCQLQNTMSTITHSLVFGTEFFERSRGRHPSPRGNYIPTHEEASSSPFAHLPRQCGPTGVVRVLSKAASSTANPRPLPYGELQNKSCPTS